MNRHPLLQELDVRGFIADCTDLAGLDQRLHEGPARIYIGFDPTADSLHVGSLMPLFVARLIQQHGHVPVLLVGGATGMIGDPSGRSSERNLLDDAALDHNRECLQRQIESLVPSSDGQTLVVDNRDWIGPMSSIELLRDVGRHFPINPMLARDSVRLRRESDAGLTFTEFAYQLLQAFDFWWLRKNLDVVAQMGGSDQWGNITAGTDFMRRKDGSTGFGLVWPLLNKTDGTKFGKSANGNVWLNGARTSPFDFWQFWFNTDDADVETMLLRFASIPLDDIDALLAEHHLDPSRRVAQRALANTVTAWVHGAELAASSAQAAAVVFGDDAAVDAEALQAVEKHMGSVPIPKDELIGMDVLDLAVRSGLCSSKREARQLAGSGALRVSGRRVKTDDIVQHSDLVGERWLLPRRGRRAVALVDGGA